MEPMSTLPAKREVQVLAPNGSTLRESKDVYYFEPLSGNRPASDGDLLGALRIILSRKYTILAIVLLGALAGWGTAILQRPMYKARTTIEIQSMAEADSLYRIIDGGWRGSGGSTTPVTAEAYIETQLHVLQSRSFRSRVANRLMAAPRAGQTRRLNPAQSLLSKIGLVSMETAPGDLPTVNPVMRTLSNTRIVEISCDSPDPDFTAEYVNTMAEQFIAYNLELQSETAERTMAWLTGQLQNMKSKVETSKATLEAYSRETGLKFEAEEPDGEKSKLKDLDKELAAARVDVLAKLTAYDVALKSASSGGVPDDRAIEYQAELVKLREQLQQLRQKYTPEHARVQALQAEIATIEKIQATRNLAQTSRLLGGLQGARMNEQRLRDATNRQAEMVSRLAKKRMEYDNLRRDLDRNQKLYEELLQKATEVSLSTAMRGSSQIRIVDRAVTPAAPYRPVMWKNLGLGILTSLFLGVGFVVVMARASHRLRVPGETPQHLGVPELSVVPRCRNLGVLPGANADGKKDPAAGGRLKSLVSWRFRHGYPGLAEQPPIVAEAFQNATTSIFAALNGKCGACKIMVTSAFQGEGKSTVLVHLGIAMAELGHRVLLVDGDLRRPRLHTLFELPNTWGFSTLITESSDLKTLPLEALAQKTPIDGLHLLAAGPGPANVSRVLHSARTAELFERLSREFEFVLIDSSPALQFSDARLIGRFVDGTILVIRAGSTSRDAAINMKDRLTTENIRVLGTILTDWNVPLSRVYEQYGT